MTDRAPARFPVPHSLVLLLLLTASACVGEAGPGWDLTGDSAPIDPQVTRSLDEAGFAHAIVEFADTATRPSIPVQMRRIDFQRLPLSAVTVRSQADLELLAHAPNVVRIHAEMSFHRTLLVDGLEQIHHPLALSAGLSGRGTAVAILDSGVDHTDAAFGSCQAPGAHCRVVVSKDFAPDDGEADDSLRHGTNVAAIVAAVAPEADIIALDVFDGDVASSSDVIAAIDWAITNKERYQIAALNLSLGTKELFTGACDDSVFAAAIDGALRAGLVTVTSSGNAASADSVSAPGCVTSAVTVGAVHATAVTAAYPSCIERAQAGDVACFSNASPLVDLLAPGSRIDAGGVIMTGTSQASPHVAGAIAAVVGGSSLSATEAVDALINAGVPVVDTRNRQTFPRLDFERVVAGLTPVAEPPPSPPAPPTEPSEPPEPPTEPSEPVEPPTPWTPPGMPDLPPVEEPAPPTASETFVIINEGADSTDTRDVTLTISAPGASVICISNTSHCTHFIEARETMEWTLGEPDANGLLTVNVWIPSPLDGWFRNIVLTDEIAFTH